MKYYNFRLLQTSYDNFERRFWSGVDLSELYQLTKDKVQKTPIDDIFLAGFSGLIRHRASEYSDEERFNQCQAMMVLSCKKWEVTVHSKLTWLATIASVSPYIGLLGTVFGVMHTFQGLLQASAAMHLNAVAPGISEALAMTAFGLFVAIPATVAYNRLSLKMESIIEHYQIFQDEFMILARRQRAVS